MLMMASIIIRATLALHSDEECIEYFLVGAGVDLFFFLGFAFGALSSLLHFKLLVS